MVVVNSHGNPGWLCLGKAGLWYWDDWAVLGNHHFPESAPGHVIPKGRITLRSLSHRCWIITAYQEP